jgi:hypothetical protein
MVPVHLAKGPSHTAADARLLTITDLIITDDMRTDIIPVPSLTQGAEYTFNVLRGTVKAALAP